VKIVNTNCAAIDKHLHIGQFYEAYYEPLEVLRIAAEAGIRDAVYSSATSAKADLRYREAEGEIAAARYPAERYKYPLFQPELGALP
jgi:hypothetical protein